MMERAPGQEFPGCAAAPDPDRRVPRQAVHQPGGDAFQGDVAVVGKFVCGSDADEVKPALRTRIP